MTQSNPLSQTDLDLSYLNQSAGYHTNANQTIVMDDDIANESVEIVASGGPKMRKKLSSVDTSDYQTN